MVIPKGTVIVWIFQTVPEKRNHVIVEKGIGDNVIEWLLTPGPITKFAATEKYNNPKSNSLRNEY